MQGKILKSQKRISILDSFKVLAIFVVFLRHIYVLLNFSHADNLQPFIWYISHYGNVVLIFIFILSGFTITSKYYDVFEKINYKLYLGFIKKRFFELYPLYLITLVISFPITDSFDQPKIGVIRLITNLTMVQSLIPDERFYFAFNALSWYVSCLMIIYLVYPFIIYMIHKLQITSIKRLYMVIFYIWILSFFVTAIFSNYEFAEWGFNISPIGRMPNFLSGVMACLIYKYWNKNWQSEKIFIINIIEFILFLIFIISFFALPYIPKAYAYCFYQMPIFTIFIIVYSLQRGFISRLIGNKYLSLFVKLVYPFYMFHQLVIRYFYTFAPLDANSTFLIIISFVLSVIISYFYFGIRQQVTKIISNRHLYLSPHL
jgi:peptidoglycan/LPS O-acetylase OafA/YrhL